jgi:hypothetical protein
MLLALVLLNFVHPGRIMRGKETDIPGRKERKEMAKKGTTRTTQSIEMKTIGA